MIDFHVSLSSLPPSTSPSLLPFISPSLYPCSLSLLPLEQCLANHCILSFIVLTQSSDHIDLQTT